MKVRILEVVVSEKSNLKLERGDYTINVLRGLLQDAQNKLDLEDTIDIKYCIVEGNEVLYSSIFTLPPRGNNDIILHTMTVLLKEWLKIQDVIKKFRDNSNS